MNDLRKSITVAIAPDGDARIDSAGHLVTDATVHSRVLVRLRAHRGAWYRDATMGSDLHKLELTKQAKAKVDATVQDALRPLVTAGEIDKVELSELDVDDGTGRASAAFRLYLPDGATMTIDGITLGSGRTT